MILLNSLKIRNISLLLGLLKNNLTSKIIFRLLQNIIGLLLTLQLHKAFFFLFLRHDVWLFIYFKIYVYICFC
jgi:hypothetical protein